MSVHEEMGTEDGCSQNTHCSASWPRHSPEEDMAMVHDGACSVPHTLLALFEELSFEETS